MATRAEAINYLRSLDGIKEGDDAFFTYDLPFNDGRSQLVFLKVLDDLIAMTSPFAKVDDITASRALEMATVFGAAKVGSFYGLRHNLFIEDLDESEVINSIKWLAAQADTLEEKVGGDNL